MVPGRKNGAVALMLPDTRPASGGLSLPPGTGALQHKTLAIIVRLPLLLK